MRFLIIFFAVLLSVSTSIAFSAEQEQVAASSSVGAASVNTNAELGQQQPIVDAAAIGAAMTQVSEPANQGAPVINAAAIGESISPPPQEADVSDKTTGIVIGVVGIIILLIIVATILGLRGNGVFFSDYTDVLVSSALSLITLISLMVIVGYSGKDAVDDPNFVIRSIALFFIVIAYVLSLLKAKAHNAGVTAPIIAVGRLFLPILIYGVYLWTRNLTVS